jgi:hypothetical protein
MLAALTIPTTLAKYDATSRRSYWRMSIHAIVHEALSNDRLLYAGYPTFRMYYHPLFNKESPYAGRHVWWCERSKREIIPFLPLNLFVHVWKSQNFHVVSSINFTGHFYAFVCNLKNLMLTL